MEIEENLEGMPDENRILDVESVEDNPEVSSSEENILHEDVTNGSIAVPGTSSDNVRGKENLPPEKKRLVKLPLSRIKQIMKMDPDCTIIGQETVFLVTKATEMFLEYLGKETGKYTHMAKRKTVLKRDVEAAIDSIPHLCFLEGALE